MHIKLPYNPRFPQDVCHPAIEKARFSVIVAHRRTGKTVMAINHLIRMAVANTLREPRYAYIAPFLKQSKLIAWSMIKHYVACIPGMKINESELTVQFPGNNAKIYLFGGDNPDALRGTYLDGVVLDEYAQMRPDLFSETIRPTLTDRNGWALFIGTPKGQNTFLEIYQTATRKMNEGDPSWFSAIYRADETNIIDTSELQQLKDTLSDATYRQELLCDFTAAADNVLITIDLVSKAVSRSYKPGELDGSPRVIGVDPARFGDDRSVIMRRQGLQAFNPLVLSKLDNMALVGRIIQEIEDFKPDAVFIDAGRGEGIIDRLRQLGHEVFEINFGGTPNNPLTYSNRRAEMWDLMKEWLIQGGCIPSLPDLKADLVVPTYDFDVNSKMRLESKDKIKDRLGKSPDIADALALTFAMTVRPKGRFHGFQVNKPKYDPLSADIGSEQYAVL